jgi:hypothetical protein
MSDDPSNITPVHSAPSSAIRHSRNPSLGLEAIGTTGHGGHAPMNKGTHGTMLDRHTSSQWSVPFSNDSFLTSAATTITSESFALTHQGSSWWVPQTSVVFQQGGNNSPQGVHFPGYYGGSPSPTSQHRSPQRGFVPAAIPLEAIPLISIERGDATHQPRSSSSSQIEHQFQPASSYHDLNSGPGAVASHLHQENSSDGGLWGREGGMELAGTNVFVATATYVDDQRGIRADASPTPIPSQAWSPSGSPQPVLQATSSVHHMKQRHTDPSSGLTAAAGRPPQQLSRRHRASTMLPTSNRAERPESPPGLQASQTAPLFTNGFTEEDSASWDAPTVGLTASKTISGVPHSTSAMSHVAFGPMTFADTLVRDLEWIRGQIEEHAAFVLHHSIHRAHRSAHALEPLARSSDSQTPQSRSNSPSTGVPPSVAQPAPNHQTVFQNTQHFSLAAMPSSSFAGQLHLATCELLRHGYYDIHQQQQPLAPYGNSHQMQGMPRHGQRSVTFPGVVVLGAGQPGGLFTPHALPSAAPRSLLPPFTVATAIGGGLHTPEAMVLRRAAGLLLIDAAWWLYHETIGRDEMDHQEIGEGSTDSPSRVASTASSHPSHPPSGADEGAAATARLEIETCLMAPSWSAESTKRIISVSSAIEELGRRLADAAGSKGSEQPEQEEYSPPPVGGPVATRSVLHASETSRQYAMAQDVLFAFAAQLPPLLASLEHLFLSRRTSHVASVLMHRALLCIEERAALRRKRARMYDALEEGQGLVGDITEHLSILEELRNDNLQLISDLQSSLQDVMRVPSMLPNVWETAPRLLQSSHAVAATYLTAAALRGIPPPHATSQKLRHMASTWHTLCGRRLNAAASSASHLGVSGGGGQASNHFVLMIVAFPELQQVPVSVMSVLLQLLADASGLPPPRHFVCESHSYCGLWVPDVLALAWATVVRSGSKGVFLRGYTIPTLVLPYWGMLDALRLVLYLPSFYDGSTCSLALPGTCVQPTAVSNFWQMHLSSRGGTANLTLVANAIGAMVGAKPEYVEHVGPSQALNVWVALAGRDGWMQFGEGQLAFVDVASGELLALDASPASLMPTTNSMHGHAHHAVAAATANGGFEVLLVARKRNRTRCGKETKKKGRPDEVRSATAV